MEDKELLQEEESNLITMTDENGVETEFEFLDCITYNEVEYLVLLPTDENDNEVVILEVQPVDEETEDYVAVEDEEILMAVYNIFKEHYKDILTFED